MADARRDGALVAWLASGIGHDETAEDGIADSSDRGEWEEEMRESVFGAVDSVFEKLFERGAGMRLSMSGR